MATGKLYREPPKRRPDPCEQCCIVRRVNQCGQLNNRRWMCLEKSLARANLRHWYVRTDTYGVLSVAADERYVVKLEAPRAARNRRFEVMAALAHIVRAQTTVPVADVVSVGSSRRRWPWHVLIESQLPGQTWAGLYPRLGELQRMAAQRQLGQAAAQLHTLTFDGYGEFGVNGRVLEPGAAVATLPELAHRRLRTHTYRDYFRQVLDAHTDLFLAAPGPCLCHEDLNPYNVPFELRKGEPVLTGVLDFEAAWAGLPESDLARLELWRWTVALCCATAMPPEARFLTVMCGDGRSSSCCGAWSMRNTGLPNSIRWIPTPIREELGPAPVRLLPRGRQRACNRSLVGLVRMCPCPPRINSTVPIHLVPIPRRVVPRSTSHRVASYATARREMRPQI